MLQYHAYAASASWLIERTCGRGHAREATPDWQAAYAYSRWRPAFFAAASSQTSFSPVRATAAGTPSSATERERQIEGGVLVPFRHVRASHAAVGVAGCAPSMISRSPTGGDTQPHALRAAWSSSTAKAVRLLHQPRTWRDHRRHQRNGPSRARRFGDATTLRLMRVRICRRWRRSTSSHFALPAARRPATSRCSGRFISAAPGPNVDPADFGRNAASLLRGFGADTFAGSRVAVLNADYRFPFAYIQRGIGTWPLFLQAVHAAVFVDAGHAWTAAFRAAESRPPPAPSFPPTSLPATAPAHAAVGAAWGRDGTGTVGERRDVLRPHRPRVLTKRRCRVAAAIRYACRDSCIAPCRSRTQGRILQTAPEPV